MESDEQRVKQLRQEIEDLKQQLQYLTEKRQGLETENRYLRQRLSSFKQGELHTVQERGAGDAASEG